MAGKAPGEAAARRLLDNRGATVSDYLRARLADAERFRLVSAYFSIYGYELLAEALDRLPEARFLFGDPASVEEVDPGGRPIPSFRLSEDGLVPRHALRQKHLAKRCADWVRRDGVRIRTARRSGFLHGKMYLTEGAGPGGAAVVGSSNFTRRGLGGSRSSNLEINLATEEPTTLVELRDWFDDLWSDREATEDAEQRVLDALNRLTENYAPETVYFKTLYEIFRDEIEARREAESSPAYRSLYESQVWSALYEFQRDGARSVIARLLRHDGCILADSVGLGKTYTALAVIRWFESRNQRVLVLCPRKLHRNWALYQAHRNHVQNPFPDDRFGYALLAHTDLSRESGLSGGIDLSSFRWENYDLIVIDESHNFRNRRGERYRRLLETAISGGSRTSVLLLSATPVNTSLADLRNQIYLMTEGREDAFSESLGVADIARVMGEGQKAFQAWEQHRASGKPQDKTGLLTSLSAEFFRLLGGVSIARSRRQIEEHYGDEMDRIGRFPSHDPPDNRYPDTDLEGRLSYREIADAIGAFTLAAYQPSRYLTDEARRAESAREKSRRGFDPRNHDRYVVAMMRINFLKRLESSPDSLRLTLERTVGKIDDLLERIERYEARGRAAGEEAIPDPAPDEDEEDEDLLAYRRQRVYRLRDMDLPRWKQDLLEDRATLDAARRRVAAVGPRRDGKLAEFLNLVRRRFADGAADPAGRPNRKLLVFTTFKDTARYLYRHLLPVAGELGIGAAMVAGDETATASGTDDFEAILTDFAPLARNRPPSGDPPRELDILIATDCISEGQNLQDCDRVVNYDIHWNPVRLIQRFGRVDRIGSRSESVRMVNFWPTEDLETYLHLERRVQARMALLDVAATGDDDPFDSEAIRRDLSFRDRQLARMRSEVLDLDELEDSPVIGDFTLDHFFSQLLRYLAANREALERMPLGAYAVADAARAPSLREGAVFLLRQRKREAPDHRLGRASPIHPHYLACIEAGGAIRFGCGLARKTLEAMEAACAGATAPSTELCDAFDRETELGNDLGAFDRLLDAALGDIRRTHDAAQVRGLGLAGRRDFLLPLASEAPKTAADFELVTWLPLRSSSG